MKVVVTLAGKSKRYQEAGYKTAKFALPVGKRSMLHRVLDMFDPNDQFLLVTTQTLHSEYREIFDLLDAEFSNIEVIEIPEHEKGPVESVLHPNVLNWIGTSEFIVTYCDFLVTWNYRAFLNHVSHSSVLGSIVSFIGLQPASRGDTLFAYLRTNKDEVLEVREKENFTENRESEFASAGIYFFRSLEVFSQAFQLSIHHLQRFPEMYVSLLFNGILEMSGRVTHFVADAFLCLGTPKDYEEWIYWSNHFDSISKPRENTLQVSQKLIPMAGSGQRFRDTGILVPKPLIPIRAEPMFMCALNSNPTAEENYVVVRDDIYQRIHNFSLGKLSKFKVLKISQKTTGPGETILSSIDNLDLARDIVILSCDYEHSIDEGELKRLLNQSDVDVVVFYTHFNRFRMSNPSAFAYAINDQNGYVKQIVEKQVVSVEPSNDQLLVGTFWFRRAELLRESLLQAKHCGDLVNGELYVANSINRLIELNIKVKAFEVMSWISFGNPDELAIYDWWESMYEFLTQSSGGRNLK